jgi:type IV fimbrial biogenesis protein FimT
MNANRHPRGFSAVELMIVLAIAVVLAMVAAPSFQPVVDRQLVRSAASNLNVDIQYARSEAVRKNAAVTVSFSAAAPWCYGIVNGTAACDCATAGSCDLKTVSGADYGNVSMTLTGGNGFTIEPRQGRVSAIAGGGPVTTAVTVSSTTTPSAHVASQLNSLGRVLQCAPDGLLPGFPAC